MSTTRPEATTLSVRAENIGGIDQTEVTLEPGVNLLVGRNATNRTSFLQALMAVMGSDQATLKGDADEGRVELTVGDETYTRRLVRQNGSVVSRGDPYPADPELGDLFAFLLETNPARRAVARGDDLRELVMEPVDTDQIKRDIEQIRAEKERVESEIDELDERESGLPELERKRQQLDDEIEDKREKLREVEAELDDTDVSVEESREEKAELEETLAELREARSDLDETRFKLDTQQESLESLREERDELEEELASLSDLPAGDRTEVDDRIDRLRAKRRELDAEINELQNVIQFNEEMLEEVGSDIAAALQGDGETAENGGVELTDQLVDGETVACWTCGTEVDREGIESTVDRLREFRREKLDERRSVRDELDDLKQTRSRLESKQRRRSELEGKLRRIDDEIERREDTVDRLEERREELTAEIEALEAEVRDLETEEYADILELHKEANQLEFELDRLEKNRETVDERIEAIRADLERRADLEAELEELRERLQDRRTRIDRIEAGAVEQFNHHMDEILDVLGYANLERIWVEKRQTETREGRQKVERSTFELHVVRTTDDGTTYEDTVDHLSESEREVTGLVFALAGYLVHDVHEVVPFMLLDSLEAIDSDRIAALVEYFREYADHLVAALLPEDAAALDDDYRRVTDI